MCWYDEVNSLVKKTLRFPSSAGCFQPVDGHGGYVGPGSCTGFLQRGGAGLYEVIYSDLMGFDGIYTVYIQYIYIYTHTLYIYIYTHCIYIYIYIYITNNLRFGYVWKWCMHAHKMDGFSMFSWCNIHGENWWFGGTPSRSMKWAVAAI